MMADLSQTAQQAPSGWLRAVAGDIKIAHSVFALPFAVLAVFLVVEEGEGVGRLAGKLGLVIGCMVFARTWAMLVNRIADRRIDAQNPRTKGRAIPAGRLSMRDAVVAAGLSGLVFWGGAGLFWVFFGNPWPTYLAVPVLGWIACYSYTKRFTALCHVFLGGALAASPIAAAIAVNPESLGSVPSLWFLAGMVLFWVAGFDVIYALQDLDHDREAGLRSIPAALGATGAIWVSRLLHLVAFGALAAAWQSDGRLGVVFGAGVVLTGLLLVIEHLVLARRGKAGIDMAFFTLNGIVSCILGTLGVVDLVIF